MAAAKVQLLEMAGLRQRVATLQQQLSGLVHECTVAQQARADAVELLEALQKRLAMAEEVSGCDAIIQASAKPSAVAWNGILVCDGLALHVCRYSFAAEPNAVALAHRNVA